ncbi:MAG: hypothetical protein ACM3SW_02685, partial [Actinomycetota bacterium]
EKSLLMLFSPAGNCLECRNYRLPTGDSGGRSAAGEARGACSVRGFDVPEPLHTFCKSLGSANEPLGAIYTILPINGRTAIPWVGLSVPRLAQATCCICGAKSEAGIRLDLPDGNVECCSPQHYLDWWKDYLRRRLEYFKVLGEKAYSDMYDVISPSAANGYYSDAKEAFYSAISTARDLELATEKGALEKRLAHIKAVFRSQFT